MTGGWRPWRNLLPLWLPAVALCLGNVALYSWQSSGSMGREARLKAELADLEANLIRLRRLQHEAATERARVEALKAELDHLRTEVFGSLDDRLTGIMRATGLAVSEPGLMPSQYAYSWEEKKELGLIRFGIQFSVIGEYPQLRRLLANLQSNREFLIVDRLSLTGEDQATSRDLRIAVGLATYLASADRGRLEQLAGEEAPPRGTENDKRPTPAAGAQASGGGDGVD
jgi:hypothetical protein